MRASQNNFAIGQVILSFVFIFLGANVFAQSNETSGRETRRGKPLTVYPVPSPKKVHPNDWYKAWPKELKRIERLFADENTSQRTRTMEHWNRFITYFKMVPDDSSQILGVFMEAYANDKHYFCQEYADWIPQLTIQSMIAEKGYPGRSLVGIKYEKVAFLVIQHSGREAIGEYLPVIREAIGRKDLDPTVYPYLFDRFEVSNGRPQHFGTQSKLNSKELFPLYEPEKVNERRRKYGLRPIAIGDQ